MRLVDILGTARLNGEMTKPTDTAQPQPPTAPAKRRVRGPNRPKPDPAITVTTEVSMGQAAIIKVLAEYVSKMQGADVAAGMELQQFEEIAGSAGGDWVSIHSPTAVHSRIRFATKGSK